MTEQPQYRPGDVANGHQLGVDGQWTPLPPPAPLVPVAQQPLQQVNVVVPRQGVNHILHLLLSVLTCGLWIPVWIALAIIDAVRGPRP